MGRVLGAFLFSLAATFASGATLFEDGFESGALSPAWTVSSTNDGRAVISSAFGPATGQAHLILDDATNDANYSVAEATFAADVTNKKNLVLSFKAKSVGNEPHAANPFNPPATTRNFDGVSFSTDAGRTWWVCASLAEVGVDWQTFSVPLGGGFSQWGDGVGENFRVRFSAYDNSPAPADGIAIDAVILSGDDDQRAVAELPSPLIEGTGEQTGYVALAFAPSAPLTLTMAWSMPHQLSGPDTVTVPAGATHVEFEFRVLDNSVADLTRSVAVSAYAPDVTPIAGTVVIYDDDAPIPSLSLPAEVVEGASSATSNATLSLDRPASVPLTVTLSSLPAGELTHPPSVSVPAGQTQVAFALAAADDSRIDGNVRATLSATAAGIQTSSAQTTTLDNEPRVLVLSPVNSVSEGGTAHVSVSVPGTLPAPLTVTLAGGNTALTVPATITIPAGSSSASFVVKAADNAARDGTRYVLISATASGFTAASEKVTIRDNEVAAYRFGGVTELVNANAPLSVTVSAVDIEGNVIPAASGTLQLSVISPDETTQPATPSSVTLMPGVGWAGAVTLPSHPQSPLRLRVTDPDGNSGESILFDLMRVISLRINDLVWDAVRQRFYASVRADAGNQYANSVVAIDPITLQVTNAVATSSEPGALALSSGGDALYASIRSNGSVARIEPGELKIASTFVIGTDAYHAQQMWAADLFVIPGKPESVVVSQATLNYGMHCGIAAYDNGTMRPNRTGLENYSQGVEPSSDPGICFALSSYGGDFPLRKLRVNANGVSFLESVPSVSTVSQNDFRMDGKYAFTKAGAVLDTDQMKRLGAFPKSGLVAPEVAVGRAYILEQTSLGSNSYDRISAYDLGTFTAIRRLTLPANAEYATSLLRWGKNGLAFRTPDTVVVMNSDQLVPSEPAADLAVSVDAAPRPVTLGAPLVYTLRVTNAGPNTARLSALTATFSAEQTLQSVTATGPVGKTAASGLVVTVPISNLAPGEAASLTVTTLPHSAGIVSCEVSATSSAIDSNFANNGAIRTVSVGFAPSGTALQQLRLPANNLRYDPSREVLWATLPSTVAAPYANTLVWLNPHTGTISEPIPLTGNPNTGCIAVSQNGRYVYVGSASAAEVWRVDLQTSPATVTTIKTPAQSGFNYLPADIEVLDGPGTSFMITAGGNAAVFDESTRRGSFTQRHAVNRLERTATPGLFVGYNINDSGPRLSKLEVTATGVTITPSAQSLLTSYNYNDEIAASGDSILTSRGAVVDVPSLTLKRAFDISGRPAVDVGNRRAYFVSGNALRAYDLVTGAVEGTLRLPTTTFGDWAQACVRWGADGFAILGKDGLLYVARWPGGMPSLVDGNKDNIADSWAVTYFGSAHLSMSADDDRDGIPVPLEYLFGDSPFAAARSQIQSTLTQSGSDRTIHMVFPRRVGIPPGSYGYEVSDDLLQWTATAPLSETVLERRTAADAEVEIISAAIPLPPGEDGFARLRWITP